VHSTDQDLSLALRAGSYRVGKVCTAPRTPSGISGPYAGRIVACRQGAACLRRAGSPVIVDHPVRRRTGKAPQRVGSSGQVVSDGRCARSLGGTSAGSMVAWRDEFVANGRWRAWTFHECGGHCGPCRAESAAAGHGISPGWRTGQTLSVVLIGACRGSVGAAGGA
jgi:hypothetical protein